MIEDDSPIVWPTIKPLIQSPGQPSSQPSSQSPIVWPKIKVVSPSTPQDTDKSNWDLLKEGMSKFPASALHFALANGMGGQQDMVAPEDPKAHKIEGLTPEWSLNNVVKHIQDSLSTTASSIANTFSHPIQSFSEDPAGTLATIGGGVQGLGEGGMALATETPLGAMAKGAAKGAYQESINPASTVGIGGIAKSLADVPGGNILLRSIMGKYAGNAIGGIFGHAEAGGQAGAALGVTAPAIKGAINGAKQGLIDYNALHPITKSILDSLNY